MKAIANIVLPFAPIVAGMLLQVSLVDEIPKEHFSAYLMAQYGRPMWLTLLVSALLMASGHIIKNNTLTDGAKQLLLGLPAAVVVICIAVVVGLPKFGLSNNWITIWIPAVLSAISLGVVGHKVGS